MTDTQNPTIDVIELANKAGARVYGVKPRQSILVNYIQVDDFVERFAALYRQALIDSGELVPAEKADAVEGGTPEDLKILRAANLQLAETEHRLRTALRFYANGRHMDISGDPYGWDTVSGEPANYWCDEAGTATIEDGTIAKIALLNRPMNWIGEDGDDQTPPEIDGEYQEIDRARSAK